MDVGGLNSDTVPKWVNLLTTLLINIKDGKCFPWKSENLHLKDLLTAIADLSSCHFATMKVRCCRVKEIILQSEWVDNKVINYTITPNGQPYPTLVCKWNVWNSTYKHYNLYLLCINYSRPGDSILHSSAEFTRCFHWIIRVFIYLKMQTFKLDQTPSPYVRFYQPPPPYSVNVIWMYCPLMQ